MARPAPRRRAAKTNGAHGGKATRKTTRKPRATRRVKALQKYLRAYGYGTEAHAERLRFAKRLGTSLPYLIHIGYGFRLASLKLATDIEKATHGLVSVEELRPDVDWSYLASHLARRAPTQAAR